MEIERKYLVKEVPSDLSDYKKCKISQGYLCTAPVVRIRRSDDEYYMTYKGKGLLEREEYNLPLTKEAYEHLLSKADGNIITKKRYLIPYGKFTIELDIFSGRFESLVIAEVEFDSVEEANHFSAPDWFDKDVTENREYSNSYLSEMK